jgi:polygalacturonase
MKYYLKILFMVVLLITPISGGQDDYTNVKSFGAKGDGVALDTKALQNAIDKVSGKGGTIYFPPGEYLIGSVQLKSNINLYISSGAIILGSRSLSDYLPHTPNIKSYNDVFLKYSLFYAEEAENISIKGEGVIDGQGSAFKVMTKQKPERYMNRPFVIRFIKCKNVHIEGITLKNSPMWMQHYFACEDLYISKIRVINHSNKNNDMMDIDGCKNVVISDCIGDTDDDAITLKSTSPLITENVTINNCIISSHCNAIKFGTESTGGFKNIIISDIIVKPSSADSVITGYAGGISGITLATVDGGIIDGVVISNIKINGPQVPIFLRLGNRGRKYIESVAGVPVGSFKNVSINNVFAENTGPYGCSITGIPGSYVENITLENISINYAGGISKEKVNQEMKELEDSYPESTMWGNLPSYAFYLRHVKNIKFSNVSFRLNMKDARPAMVCSNVENLQIYSMGLDIDKSAEAVFVFANVSKALISDTRVMSEVDCFVKVIDKSSNDITLKDNIVSKVNHLIIAPDGVRVIIEGNIQ